MKWSVLIGAVITILGSNSAGIRGNAEDEELTLFASESDIPKHLKKIELENTDVSDAVVKKLRLVMPNCTINKLTGLKK